MAITAAGYLSAVFTVPSGVTFSATNNAGTASISITAGVYRAYDFCTHVATALNAQLPVSGGTWTVTFSSGAAAGDTGFVTIAVTAGTYSITWTSTDLRDLLGFAGNISSQTTATGTQQHRGMWLPDCPLYLDGADYKTAPRVTDLRQSVTPTGLAYGHVNNVSYRHNRLRYSHVAADRVWASQETTVNTSLERFLEDTQWRQGHALFSTSSRVTPLAHTGSVMGGSVLYWSLMNVGSLEAIVKRRDEWDGLWTVEFPLLVSDGSGI